MLQASKRLSTLLRRHTTAKQKFIMSKSRSSSSGTSKTATYVLIGDEILSGTVQDTNGPFLAKYFRNRGIDLLRIEVIPDKIEVIVETLNRVRVKSDYVVTSGGIGPTHDDVTYEAVASTFGVGLAYDDVTLGKMSVHMKSRNSEINEARKRMVLFPQGCKTHFVGSLWVPVVVMDNIHIYPGVPRLFEQMLSGSDELFAEGRPFVQYEVFTSMVEGDFASALTQTAADHPLVKIGSYPSLGSDGKFFTRLFIEGRDEKIVKSVADSLATLTNAYQVTQRHTETPVPKL
jgi:molybdenum cofactor synthesis domain-containing protein